MFAMKATLSTGIAGIVVLGAAGLALLHPWEASGSAQASATLSTRRSESPDPGMSLGGSLPANHPPIDATASPHDGMHAPLTAPDETPAITWQAPAAWKAMPNPNPMRIATYRPTADSELIVVRAGGTTDANIQRWIGQFDEGVSTKRTRRTVQGLGVEILEASGTYNGGGMMGGAPAQPHPGWSLLGAVIETPGTAYFFKLLGPSDQIRAAHPSFDAFVGSIHPL
jgi:hypothetical protein